MGFSQKAGPAVIKLEGLGDSRRGSIYRGQGWVANLCLVGRDLYGVGWVLGRRGEEGGGGKTNQWEGRGEWGWRVTSASCDCEDHSY